MKTKKKILALAMATLAVTAVGALASLHNTNDIQAKANAVNIMTEQVKTALWFQSFKGFRLPQMILQK